MEQWESDLTALIQEKGEPLGVNTISQALGVPLSTMQKRLEKSSFVKTKDRKWDIPSNVVQSAVVSDVYALALDSNVGAIKAYCDMIATTLDATVKLIDIQKNLPQPVAISPELPTNNTTKIDKRLQDVLDNIKLLPKFVKEHKDNIRTEYHDMLDNTDWMLMFIDIGKEGSKPVFEGLNAVILGDTDYLNENVTDMLNKYQKT